MPVLIVQLAALVAIAFIVGAVLGRLAKGRKAASKDKEDIIIAAALAAPAGDEKAEVQPTPQAALAEKPDADTGEREDKADEDSVEAPNEEAGEAPGTIEVEEPDEAVVVVEVPEPDHRPERLEAPLRGKADDLTAITGIGNAVQAMLHELGVFHYAQIAQWNADEAKWIEDRIGFAGRVSREKWVAQAKRLAESARKPAPKRSSRPRKTASGPKNARTRQKKTQA